MKKTYKIIIFSVVGIVIAATIFMILSKKSDSLEILSIPYEFYLNGDKNQVSIDIPLYLTEKDSEYLNKNNITKTYLVDSETNDVYQVDLDSIDSSTDNYTYHNKDYYLYEVECSLPFNMKDDFVINNTYLKFKYSSGDEISVRIGSIYVYYDNTSIANKYLTYSSMKGITKIYQDEIMLNAVIVKINPNDKNINITSIDPISLNSIVNLNEVKLINNPEDDSYYYQSEYNQIINLENKMSENININVDSESYLLIPLLYEEYIETPIIGFNIHYVYDNQEYTLLVKPFQYYSYSTSSIKPESVYINK